MQKLNIFFKTLTRSIVDSSYYPDILKTSFWFSAKYLLFLLFVSSVIQIVPVVYQFNKSIPEINPWIAEIKRVAYNFYPNELEITAKNNRLITNVEEPYYIMLPKIKSLEQYEGRRLIAIDTKGIVDDFMKYHSVVLVTDKAIVYPKENKATNQMSYEVNYFNSVPDSFKLNKSVYMQFVKKIEPYWNNVPTYLRWLLVGLVILGPVTMAVLGFSWQLSYLTLFALLLFIMAKIMKKQLSFMQLFRLGMHGITLPIIVTTIFGLFSINIPLLFCIVFLVWMGMVLKDIKTA